MMLLFHFAKSYNNRAKRHHLLNEWQGMRLTRAIKDDQTASEMDVFQSFVARIMDIQGKLSKSYQGDRYLRDRLQEEIYIPAIQHFLKDRPEKSGLNSQDRINRVGNKLSDRSKTAGAASLN